MLTASTMCRMPSSEQIERVAPRLREQAFAGIDQQHGEHRQFDAPVAMLRVYCSWPGVSATMKERMGVQKYR